MIDKKQLEALVYTDPLGLLTLRSKEDIDLANSYLPYSTGFEIECEQAEDYTKQSFDAIPNIMEIASSGSEQRYRIPNGINGLICLYHISNEAKRSLLLNYGSGIHYHVDCTDCWRRELAEELIKQREWIIADLDKWKNKGTYNSIGVSIGAIPDTRDLSYASVSHLTSEFLSSWVRANHLQTLEFRIGEMTFEYTDWVKCIVEVNKMVKSLKDAIDVPQPVYKEVDTRAIMKYNTLILRGRVKKSREDFLKEKLSTLNAPVPPPPAPTSLDAMREAIRNRTQNL